MEGDLGVPDELNEAPHPDPGAAGVGRPRATAASAACAGGFFSPGVGARLNLDSGYFSRLLRTLEAQQLTATERDAADARVRRVVLTEARNMYLRNDCVEIPPYNSNPDAHHWFEKRQGRAAPAG